MGLDLTLWMFSANDEALGAIRKFQPARCVGYEALFIASWEERVTERPLTSTQVRAARALGLGFDERRLLAFGHDRGMAEAGVSARASMMS